MSVKKMLLGLSMALVAVVALSGEAHADGATSIANAPLLQTGVQQVGSGINGGGPERRKYWRIDLKAGDILEVNYTLTSSYVPGDDPLVLCLLDPAVNDDNRRGSKCTGFAETYGTKAYKFLVPIAGRWTVEFWSCVEFCSSSTWTYSFVAGMQSPAIPPSKQPPAAKSYLVVASGDSFATGLGTQSLPVTNSGCHQVDAAWPNMLPYPAINIACSGARINALFDSFQGEQAQIEHLKALKPAVVLLMVGGNDAKFSAALLNCFARNCAGGKLNASGEAIALLKGKLTGTYMAIAEALPRAKLLVVGYPRIFPAYPQPIVNCGWLNRYERLLVNHMAIELQETEVEAVNTANMKVGGKRRIYFVSTLGALAGHELCNYNSWLFKLAPLCLKDARCGHPTAPGQRAIAAVVGKALQRHMG